MTGLQHLPIETIWAVWIGLVMILIGGLWLIVYLSKTRDVDDMDTYEIGKPWIIWHYHRPDWLAVILGGQLIGECNICGQKETLYLGYWGIWFPPKDPTFRHPKRDYFIAKHRHFDKPKDSIFMKNPLLNPFGR